MQEAAAHIPRGTHHQVDGDNQQDSAENILKCTPVKIIDQVSADNGTGYSGQSEEKSRAEVDTLESEISNRARQGIEKSHREGDAGDNGRGLIRVEEKQYGD